MASNQMNDGTITQSMMSGILIGLIVGFVLTAIFGPTPRRRKETWVSFRMAGGGPTGSPYRDERATEAKIPTLTEVLAVVRRAGLHVRARVNGFDLHGEGRVLTVRTLDPARVTLASLEIVDRATETLVFELALALVGLYGPILVTEAMFGSHVVDGSCDATSLREQRSERIRSIMRLAMIDLDDMNRSLAALEKAP